MRASRMILMIIPLLAIFFSPPSLSASDRDSTVTISVNPIDTLVVLGDSLEFEASVTNLTANTIDVDVWFTATPDTGGSEVLIPAVALCVPNNPQAVTLDPYETRGGSCWLWVPAWEAPGGYTLTGKVGEYVNIDSLVYDEDNVHFWVVE
jgi:hypothetical protein